MGLFGGRGNDGDHDANGSDDGYVSPFDNQSNYVNIDDSSYTASTTSSPQTPTATPSGPQSAYTEPASAPSSGRRRKAEPSSADTALRSNARYRDARYDDVRHGDAGPGITPDDTSTGSSGRKSKSTWWSRLVTVFIILCLLPSFSSVIGGLFGWHRGSSRTNGGSSGYATTTPTSKPAKYEVLDRTGKLTYLKQSSKTLSAEFTVVSARRGPKSCSAQNTVLVKYQAKNTSKTDIDMQSYLSFDVYDSGIGLRQVGCFAGGNPDGYDFSDSIRKIAPGGSLEFMKAYELRNNNDTLFDVRVGNYARNMPTSIGASFTLPKDSTATDVTSPGKVVKPDMPQGFTLGMTRLDGASYRYDDILGDQRGIDIKATGVRRGPKTYSGKNTVIVTYQWVNRTPIPLTFTNAVTTTAYQDGVELKQTVFSQPFAGYSVATRDVPVMEDVPMTTTMAYELLSDSKPVTTSVKGYAGLDGKTVKKEFSLG
ncbi:MULTISPECIES: DUF5067 domain-containing protein [Bifidobacterium]|nr:MULTISPECIES: DUF5067 domain-containing protein [Bifidobacterium]